MGTREESENEDIVGLQPVFGKTIFDFMCVQLFCYPKVKTLSQVVFVFGSTLSSQILVYYKCSFSYETDDHVDRKRSFFHIITQSWRGHPVYSAPRHK